MGSNQKESNKSYYKSYIFITLKIRKLKKKISTLNERLKLYEELCEESKLKHDRYMKKKREEYNTKK